MLTLYDRPSLRMLSLAVPGVYPLENGRMSKAVRVDCAESLHHPDVERLLESPAGEAAWRFIRREFAGMALTQPEWRAFCLLTSNGAIRGRVSFDYRDANGQSISAECYVTDAATLPDDACNQRLLSVELTSIGEQWHREAMSYADAVREREMSRAFCQTLQPFVEEAKRQGRIPESEKSKKQTKDQKRLQLTAPSFVPMLQSLINASEPVALLSSRRDLQTIEELRQAILNARRELSEYTSEWAARQPNCPISRATEGGFVVAPSLESQAAWHRRQAAAKHRDRLRDAAYRIWTKELPSVPREEAGPEADIVNVLLPWVMDCLVAQAPPPATPEPLKVAIDFGEQHQAVQERLFQLVLECANLVSGNPKRWRNEVEWLCTLPIPVHIVGCLSECDVPPGREVWYDDGCPHYEDHVAYCAAYDPIVRQLVRAWQVLIAAEDHRQVHAHVNALAGFTAVEARRVVLVTALLSPDFDGSILPTTKRSPEVPPFPWPWRHVAKPPHSIAGRQWAECSVPHKPHQLIERSLHLLKTTIAGEAPKQDVGVGAAKKTRRKRRRKATELRKPKPEFVQTWNRYMQLCDYQAVADELGMSKSTIHYRVQVVETWLEATGTNRQSVRAEVSLDKLGPQPAQD